MNTCQICGAVLPRNRTKFCSDKCYEEYKNKNALERYHKKKQITYVEKTCKTCGKKFKTNLSHKKYCSPECYYQAGRESSKKYAKEHRKKTQPKPVPKPSTQASKPDWQIYDFTKFDFGQSKETIPKACLKCAYCRTLTGSNRGIRVCHYCIDTGDPRGCSTKECIENKIHFKPRPRKKRQKVGVI